MKPINIKDLHKRSNEAQKNELIKNINDFIFANKDKILDGFDITYCNYDDLGNSYDSKLLDEVFESFYLNGILVYNYYEPGFEDIIKISTDLNKIWRKRIEFDFDSMYAKFFIRKEWCYDICDYDCGVGHVESIKNCFYISENIIYGVHPDNCNHIKHFYRAFNITDHGFEFEEIKCPYSERKNKGWFEKLFG